MNHLSKTQTVSRLMQLAVAGILLQTLFFKFTGAEESVYIFRSNVPETTWSASLSSELDAAADWYETTINYRDPFAIVYANAPVTSALREHHRRPTLAKMMNLPWSARLSAERPRLA